MSAIAPTTASRVCASLPSTIACRHSTRSSNSRTRSNVLISSPLAHANPSEHPRRTIADPSQRATKIGEKALWGTNVA